MEKTVSIIDLFDAFIEKNHANNEKVLIAVEAYAKAYDIFDNVRIITDPAEDEIEEEFRSNDDWEFAIYEKGKRIEKS